LYNFKKNHSYGGSTYPARNELDMNTSFLAGYVPCQEFHNARAQYPIENKPNKLIGEEKTQGKELTNIGCGKIGAVLMAQ